MPSRRESLQHALLPHLAWLRNLRWVGAFERWPSLIALLLIVLTGIAVTWQSPRALGLATPLTHLALFGAITLCAPRRLTAPLLGTLCISLLNYGVVLLVQPPRLDLIDNAYRVLGVLALLLALWRIPGLATAWAGIGAYTQQDDFRWLLTSAPLWLRWRFERELAMVGEPAPRGASPDL